MLGQGRRKHAMVVASSRRMLEGKRQADVGDFDCKKVRSSSATSSIGIKSGRNSYLEILVGWTRRKC